MSHPSNAPSAPQDAAPEDPGPVRAGTDPAGRMRVWDPLVRVFHWVLATAVLVAFLTEDEFLGLHAWAGYTVIALIAVRLLWGLIGPRHARFSDFVRGPRKTLAYLGDILRGHPARYLGHNPAGAAMAVALMAGFGATAVVGLVLLGAGEFAGPLAPWLWDLPSGTVHELKDIHETLAWGTLLLVPLHLLGVAAASLHHRENLVRSMIDGYKRNSEQP
jgi:cytochrome b